MCYISERYNKSFRLITEIPPSAMTLIGPVNHGQVFVVLDPGSVWPRIYPIRQYLKDKATFKRKKNSFKEIKKVRH